MFKKLALQLLFLFTVSTIIAIFLNYFSINLVVGFLVGTIFQYAVFYGFSSILDIVASFKNKKLEIEKLRQLSFQGLEVICPCHKQIKEFVPIKLNTSNYYKCTECKKNIGVYISSETAIVTEPADSSLQHIETVLAKGLINANI
jgi:hypothetical protein